MMASERGHTEAVKMLLGHPDIDVNLQNKVKLYFISCPSASNLYGIILEYSHYIMLCLNRKENRFLSWYPGGCTTPR